ncbi:MAG: LysM peptidoglycan-binding domain-containing protein [Bacteroidota bacterium]
MMRPLLLFAFLVMTAQLSAQLEGSFDLNKFLVNIKPSPGLTSSFAKLNAIRTKQINGPFNIVHFGDSHIQGDSFSGEIRKLLQAEYGYAGQGIIFPYALSRSHGPKGVKSTTTGTWTGTNILSDTEEKNIGLTGYTLSTTNPSGTLSFEITDKFKGRTSRRISIWSSADAHSFDYSLGEGFEIVSEIQVKENLKVRTYVATSDVQSFRISLFKSHDAAHQFYFHGFEFVSEEMNGINYYQCGVVGAQFSHLIKHAELVPSQLQQLKPDLIIFSFGTNEAYSSKIDTNLYYRLITTFVQRTRKLVPGVAFLITTAPDTRSQGRAPASQQTVNRQLQQLAEDLELSLFDLNEAMGGWGSLNRWYSNNLVAEDKLHFNSKGYELQGKMLSHSFIVAYNNSVKNGTIKTEVLYNELETMLRPLFENERVTVSADTVAQIENNEVVKVEEKPKPPPVTPAVPKAEPKPKTIVHTVRSGDTVSEIAVKYRSSVKRILKANDLKENSIIRPGQKLTVPLD